MTFAAKQMEGGRPQKGEPDPCNSTLYRVGDAFKYTGKGVTYSGLTIAAIGAPAGGVGSAPGLVISEGGGALGAAGQAFQDFAFNRPKLEIATRFAVNLFGGKVFTAAVPSTAKQVQGRFG